MRFLPIVVLVIISAGFFSCSKGVSGNEVSNPGGPQHVKLLYPDSVFYITARDYFVDPVKPIAGNYLSFPEGLSIDQSTGRINVSKSDAGLKYRVSLVENGKSDTLSTYILISGINYLDGFYNLAKGDSILKPVYNANPANVIPGIGTGTIFDIGSNCNKQGCKVNEQNAEINLAQTVRNGVFGATPSNNDRHEFEMTYRIKDNSNQVDNLLKVKLYFFNSMSEVTPEAFDIISSRQGTIIGPSNTATAPVAVRAAKPRPPCIFIILR